MLLFFVKDPDVSYEEPYSLGPERGSEALRAMALYRDALAGVASFSPRAEDLIDDAEESPLIFHVIVTTVEAGAGLYLAEDCPAVLRAGAHGAVVWRPGAEHDSDGNTLRCPASFLLLRELACVQRLTRELDRRPAGAHGRDPVNALASAIPRRTHLRCTVAELSPGK